MEVHFKLFTEIGQMLWSPIRAFSETRINYWASYATDLACPLVFAYLGFRNHFNWLSAMLEILAGLAMFSFVEYSIHRWLLHNSKTPFFLLHEAHHAHPEKHIAFFFPTSILTLLSAWILFGHLLHLEGASFTICGFSVGYCYFGILHHLEHSSRINQLPFRWLQKRWAAHSVHHHLDRNNFGVITSFWDYVFETLPRRPERKFTI